MNCSRTLVHCLEDLASRKGGAIAIVSAVFVFTMVFSWTLSYKVGVEQQINEHYKAIIHPDEGSIQYNFIGISPQDALSHTQRAKDLAALRERFSSQALFAGMIWENTIEHFRGCGPVRISLMGADPDYFAIRGYRLVSGRQLDEHDERIMARYCVITSQMAVALFHDSNAIGSSLTIDGMNFLIKGVRKCQVERPMYENEWGPNSEVLIPFSTAGRIFGLLDGPVMIRFKTKAGTKVGLLRNDIIGFLSLRHPSRTNKPPFKVLTFASVSAIHREHMRSLYLYGLVLSTICFLTCISIVSSLLLQVMNQKTMEIAIKRALGATIQRISVELTCFSLMTVALGLAFALLLIAALTTALGHLPISVYRNYPMAIDLSSVCLVASASLGMAVLCVVPSFLALKRLSVAELLH